jgi:hypothetical protein
MSIGKKFAHKAEGVKGSLKRTAGRLTGTAGACAPEATVTGSRAT